MFTGYYLIIRQGEVYRLLSHYQTGRSLQAIISLSDREKFTCNYLIIREGEVYRLLSHYQTGRSLQAIISLSDRERFTGFYLEEFTGYYLIISGEFLKWIIWTSMD